MKAVQELFDDSKIKFSNEYYDTLGLERPDEEMCVLFEQIAVSEGLFWRKAD